MEVKPGYRLTEVGVIPEQWVIKRLGALGRVVRGGSPRPAGDPRFFNGSHIPWLTVGSLTNIPTNQLFVTDTAEMLTKEGSKRSRMLQRGTLVIVNSGARTLGVAKVISITCCANDGIAALSNQTAGDKRFLCYYLNTQTNRLREVIAAGNDQLNLNTSRIASIAVPFPPEPEQQTIAAALGDVDALIGSLDRLIAKKRDLKQAAMQQLLTGQTRLPGFRGEWEVKRYGELYQFLNTANNPRSDLTEFGDIGYVHYGDIHTNPSAFLDCATASLPHIEHERVKGFAFVEDGDLVMADASEDYVGIGKCVEVKRVGSRRIVAGLHTFLLRGDKERLADGFKGYLQFLPAVRSSLARLATGISVFGVSKSNVKGIEVRLPRTDEQAAIASVLSDMDAEIEALENRRDKIRLLKQGMMQELLTGKTRLI